MTDPGVCLCSNVLTVPSVVWQWLHHVRLRMSLISVLYFLSVGGWGKLDWGLIDLSYVLLHCPAQSCGLILCNSRFLLIHLFCCCSVSGNFQSDVSDTSAWSEGPLGGHWFSRHGCVVPRQGRRVVFIHLKKNRWRRVSQYFLEFTSKIKNKTSTADFCKIKNSNRVTSVVWNMT